MAPLMCDKLQDASYNDETNDDFAEFEDFDAEDDFVQVATPKSENGAGQTANRVQDSDKVAAKKDDDFADMYENDDNDDDGVVEEEDNEFEHFEDEEEFEGYVKGDTTPPIVDQKTGEPKLTMAKVPLHFRYWSCY